MKRTLPPKKLPVRTETVRNLEQSELRAVNGGNSVSVGHTYCYCPSDPCSSMALH